MPIEARRSSQVAIIEEKIKMLFGFIQDIKAEVKQDRKNEDQTRRFKIRDKNWTTSNDKEEVRNVPEIKGDIK